VLGAVTVTSQAIDKFPFHEEAVFHSIIHVVLQYSYHPSAFQLYVNIVHITTLVGAVTVILFLTSSHSHSL
jgi:hypothetical protein